MLLLALAVPVFAETVNLKNGKSINGKILERSDKSVKIDSGGIPMTYYADEVADIDGVPMAAVKAATKTTASAAAIGSSASGSKRDLILKFIEVFGTRAAMTQNLDAMVKSLPADNPQTAKIKEGIKVDEIIERLLPIYDKQFSEQDLNNFITFYSSPAGRKLVEGIPVIMRESIEVSGQYFQEKFPEAVEENKN